MKKKEKRKILPSFAAAFCGTWQSKVGIDHIGTFIEMGRLRKHT